MMWFGLARMALKTGAEVYKNKQETKQLESLAAKNQMAKMAAGELEYRKSVLNKDQGYKDDIVLLIVILPIVILSWSVFSGDDQAKEKLPEVIKVSGTITVSF